MLRTRTACVPVLVLILVAARTPLRANGPEVITQTLELDFFTDQFGRMEHRVPLQEEVSLRDVSWVVVEPFLHTISTTGGAIDYGLSVAVASDELKVVSGSLGGGWAWGQFTDVRRGVMPVTPRSTRVDSLVFSINQNPRNQPDQPPATSVFIGVTGHIGNTEVRVHFVRGSFEDGGPHQLRPFTAPSAEVQSGGDSDWTEGLFEKPVPSANLRLVFHRLPAYFSNWTQGAGGAMAELQLRLEGDDYRPLDDAFSPSTGATTAGIASSNSGYFEDPGETFDGRDIVGWRWRLHTDGDPSFSFQGQSDIGLYFAYDYQDCDANGVPDAEELAAGVLADCDGNGVPDPCDPDCDGNGVPDACDIAGDNGRDCNRNGLLDSCELAALDVDLEPAGSVEGTHRASAPVDFTGDGLMDLIAAGTSPRALRALEAEPGGGFRESASLKLARNPIDVAAVARPEGGALVALSLGTLGSAEVHLHEVSAGGDLTAGDVVDVSGTARGVILARVDDDPYVDLLLLHRSEDAFSLLLGKPGGFGEPRLFPAGDNPSSMDVADTDGDGRVDLIATAASRSLTATVYDNGGASEWRRRDVETVARPDHVLFDVNGGRLELLVESRGTLEVFREEDATGQLILASTSQLPYAAQDLELFDLDGDGRKELVTAHGRASEVSISRWLDDGTLETAQRIVHGGSPSDIFPFGSGGAAVIDTLTGEILSLVPRGPTRADLDCDGSGLLDACEIAAGFIEDMNGNQVPDSCEGAARFRRGDCNSDAKVDVADAVCMLDSLFGGAPAVDCAAAVDANGDGNANIADAVSLLNFLFGGGAELVEPFPDCGSADAGTLSCRVSNCR